jgi:hypothetical protein
MLQKKAKKEGKEADSLPIPVSPGRFVMCAKLIWRKRDR